MRKGVRRFRSVPAMASILVVLSANGVLADEDSMKANYGKADLGFLQPRGDLDDAGYDTGVEFSLTYGRYLAPGLVLEATFGVFATDDVNYGTTNAAGAYKQDNVLTAGGLQVTLKKEIPVGAVNLFGGIGAGIYSVTLDSDIETTRLGDFNAEDSDGTTGLHLVAGLTHDLNNRFFIGIEGMYRWTDDVVLSETAASVPVEYRGDLSGTSMTITGGIRF